MADKHQKQGAGMKELKSSQNSEDYLLLKYPDGLVVRIDSDGEMGRALQSPDIGDDERGQLMNLCRQEVEVNEPTTDMREARDKSTKRPESEESDIEEAAMPDGHASNSNGWSVSAILALLSIYESKEEEMENGLNKKSKIWKEITQKLNEMGYNLTQNKVECKWRYMVEKYNDIRTNKKTTGGKRKTFQYYSQMNAILSKRHDINPPMASGSGCVAPAFSSSRKRRAASSKVKETLTGSVTEDEALPEDSESETSLVLSTSKSAVGRRKIQKEKAQEKGGVLDFLKEMEANRKEESARREDSRQKRAEDRNNLLREFLTVLKKDS